MEQIFSIFNFSIPPLVVFFYAPRCAVFNLPPAA